MEQVEQPIVTVKEEPKVSPEDMAAHDYKNLQPKFWALIEPMSRRQQQRVFKALIEYPLEDNFPTFSYPEEKDAFYIGINIFDCKFIMLRHVMELTQNKEAMEEFKKDLETLNKPQVEITE